MLFIDAPFGRRLERAEGTVSARMIQARARLEPSSGAAWREIGGALAMFDGVGSPITQAFGLGLSGPTLETDVAAIEAFFGERGADTNLELSPLAGVETYAMLAERGYRPLELSNVLVRGLEDAESAQANGGGVSVRLRGRRTRRRGWRPPSPAGPRARARWRR